jgi:hypothetical protein
MTAQEKAIWRRVRKPACHATSQSRAARDCGRFDSPQPGSATTKSPAADRSRGKTHSHFGRPFSNYANHSERSAGVQSTLVLGFVAAGAATLIAEFGSGQVLLVETLPGI